MSKTTPGSGDFIIKNGDIIPKAELQAVPVYKRSEKEAPFCPYCGDELDSLDMINYFADCSCGKWSEWMRMGGKPPHSGYTYKAKSPTPIAPEVEE